MGREGEVEGIGYVDGVDEVDTVAAEQGLDVVLATLAPGCLGWDEGARHAGAYEDAVRNGAPDGHEEAYYRGYARGGRERAERYGRAVREVLEAAAQGRPLEEAAEAAVRFLGTAATRVYESARLPFVLERESGEGWVAAGRFATREEAVRAGGDGDRVRKVRQLGDDWAAPEFLVRRTDDKVG